jgi:hypothetical protein
MSTLKVNAITDAAGANGNAITLASDGTCTAKVTNNLSNRNLIINGAMNVAQYGQSISAEGYTCDRFNLLYTGADEAPTLTQHSLSTSDTGPFGAGFRNSLHLQNGNQTGGAGAGDYMILRYKVEAQDLANSGWNYKSATSYITLSYWVKSSVAQNFYGYLRSDDGTGQLYAWETGSLSADTWTKITKKIPGQAAGNIDINDDNGIGMMIVFPTWWGGNWTNNNTLNTWAAFDSANRTPDWTSTWYTTNDATFEITGVQLEVGDVATDFEHRSYSDELARCQRYYYRIDASTNTYYGSGNIDGSNSSQILINLGRDMRAAPSSLDTTGTATHYILRTTSNQICTSVPSLSGHQNTKNAMVYFIKTSHGFPSEDGAFGRSNDNSSFLGFSAEL